MLLGQASLSMLEVNPDNHFEGRSFRRYTKSALLDLHQSYHFPAFAFTINLISRMRSSISFVRPHLLARGEFFSQNRHPKVASLHALDDAELQHLHDFLHGGPCLQRIFDVTPSTRRVHVG